MHFQTSKAMSWEVQSFRGQKYSSIKKECAKLGELFVDPEFPPNNKSLFFSKVDKEIVWKRPKVHRIFIFLQSQISLVDSVELNYPAFSGIVQSSKTSR